MTPGALAIVDFLTEFLVKEQLEREAARAAEIDRTRNAEQNVAVIGDEQEELAR